ERLPANRIAVLNNTEIRAHLAEAVETTLSRLEIEPADSFSQRLHSLAGESRQHRSPHRHRLSDNGLDPEWLADRFADILARHDFGHDRFATRE
ncbi:MAG: hypothetical protein V2J19_11115, partial [Wenzhouxiangella sp.]|nr:hypothetical protein [Wenzhouxiangella sp.]